MKNTKLIHIVLVLTAVFFLSACEQQPEEKEAQGILKTQSQQIKLAVLSTSDFFPDRAVQQRMGLPTALASRIIEKLTISNRFQVLERTALRKVINEQQFGQESKVTFLDRTLDAAIDNLPIVSGYTVAVTASASDSNDLIKDYQNLGTAMGADFLVFAVLEKATKTTKQIDLPYSESNKGFTQNKTDARLRLRIINTKTGNIAGAASFRTQLRESLLTGQDPSQDEFSAFDQLGTLASNKILDITFPAKIVSTDPLVINRGKNDNYTEGSTFKILREGKEISDSNGVIIGRVKSAVGNIKLASLQDTISIVALIDGDVQTDDLLEITEAANEQSKTKARTTHTDGKQNGKITLAVGKIRVTHNGNNKALVEEYRNRVKNDLLVKLTNSKRFDVLERQEVDQLIDEKTFAALTQGDSIEGKLSEMIEADYIIMPSVNDFIIRTEEQKVAYVDQIQSRHFGIIDATLRIVDSHTGQLLAADKIRVNKKLDNYSQQISQTLYADMVDNFTTTLVSRIMLRLYPIKIIGAISETDFYINRGADGGLNNGMLFDVMREGKEMFDPDTGISFGKIEQKVAQVSVQNIEPSRSIVHLVTGENINNGDVLRISKQEVKKAPATKIRKPNF